MLLMVLLLDSDRLYSTDNMDIYINIEQPINKHDLCKGRVRWLLVVC